MKLSLIAPPIVALAVAAIFTGGNTTEGYALIGHNLSLTQRHFRVNNNLTASGANNNTTADANFPDSSGFVMAMWKGAIEWSSLPHGDGSGDPTQPILGSGGANFDPSFQGETTQIGNLGDNICSGISGNSGGVLAYAEINGSGAWRMRFYQGWTWADGPGSIGFSEMDLQSVATHEYGHCLGLDHSSNGSATMAPSIGNGQISSRSIHSDDINGLVAIYGAAAATKPTISDVVYSGNTVTITGTNFSASGNEVWFTRADNQGSGDPLKVTNASSSAGGTQIVVTVPSNVRNGGDILVKKTGSTHSSLSNPYPVDLTAPVCPGEQVVCFATPNSTGNVGNLFITGSQNVAANDTILHGNVLPPNQFGIFLYGQGSSGTAVGNGFFCLGGAPFFRLPIVMTDIFGQVNYQIDFNNMPLGGDISQGETWNFQLWHREDGGQSNFSETLA
ncbi:MAG: matrixin family metalloprotease, partial [Planctomycetes bacterium]|nr:matrixin family metalloprotease [Planctomycetota bacterium]